MLKSYQWNNISEIFDLSTQEGHLKIEVKSIESGWLIENESFSLKLYFTDDSVNTVTFDNNEEFENTELMQRGEILRRYNVQRPQTIKIIIFNKNLNHITLDLQDSWFHTEELGKQKLFTSRRNLLQALKSLVFSEKLTKVELGKEKTFNLSILDFTRLFLVLGKSDLISLFLKINTESRDYEVNCRFLATKNIFMTELNK